MVIGIGICCGMNAGGRCPCSTSLTSDSPIELSGRLPEIKLESSHLLRVFVHTLQSQKSIS